MFLLLCESCDDVKRVRTVGATRCSCRLSRASWPAPGKLHVTGPCVVMGVHDATLRRCITRKRGAGMWWLLPATSKVLQRTDAKE